MRTVESEQRKGLTPEHAAKKIGVMVTTLSRWKQAYGGLKMDQANRLKQVEQAHLRLKQRVADLALDRAILQEVAEGTC